MPLVIGVDEAGYAPNLGPLVVAATAWHVPRNDFDFYSELSEHVCSVAGDADDRLMIADSKTAYRSGGSVACLESAVLALLASYTPLPQHIAGFVELVCGSEIKLPALYEWVDDAIPRACEVARVERCRASLAGAFASKEMCLHRIAGRMIFPEEFNRLVDEYGNKAAVLSAVTLSLVSDLLRTSSENCSIVCDRHGGRARYAPLLQQYLTEQWIHVIEETPTCSSYHWSDVGRSFEIHFRVGGESFLPTAAASMTAKYLRELMMSGWNGFWQRLDAGLRPTAGYPGDAKRFLRDVEPFMQRLGIDRDLIWRWR